MSTTPHLKSIPQKEVFNKDIVLTITFNIYSRVLRSEDSTSKVYWGTANLGSMELAELSFNHSVSSEEYAVGLLSELIQRRSS